MRSKISLKNVEIEYAAVEVVPSSCGIAIEDIKRSCLCPPLIGTEVSSFISLSGCIFVASGLQLDERKISIS